MEKVIFTRDQNLVQFVFFAPFFVAVIMLIINLAAISGISLLPSHKINYKAFLIFAVVYFFLVFIFAKWKKIDMGFSRFKPKKRVAVVICLIVAHVCTSMITVMSFEMNFNYWLRSHTSETLQLVVVDKHISTGRNTDHYITFSSIHGQFSKHTGRRTFSIGETYKAKVNKGYFEGYFISGKLELLDIQDFNSKEYTLVNDQLYIDQDGNLFLKSRTREHFEDGDWKDVWLKTVYCNICLTLNGNNLEDIGELKDFVDIGSFHLDTRYQENDGSFYADKNYRYFHKWMADGGTITLIEH